MFVVRSLLMFEKILTRNNLAATHVIFCPSGIQQLVDGWDKCLNENLMITVIVKRLCLLNL